MLDIFSYTPKGDKHNSDFFNEYLIKIYERRKLSGLTELLGNISAIVIQVQTGDALAYLQELYLMTPYRYSASYMNQTHKIFCLINNNHTPALIVMEPLNPNYIDDISRINKIYPNACQKFNARYVGEIIQTQSLTDTVDILQSHNFRFFNADSSVNPFYYNKNFVFTRMSDLTFNRVGYTQSDIYNWDSLELGQQFYLTTTEQNLLNKLDALTIEHGIKPLIKGIDHLATRILAGEREDAILEYLCLSNYYFWGAYNITDMNSSTNVSRAVHGDDIKSPAKVFTANNTPYMINSFKNLPMPTEDFVRNYGRRLHHIAYEIIDGDHISGEKNIDFVIKSLRDDNNILFLAKVFGACEGAPDLKQIFSKHSEYSLLITEYVERCHGFDGFFTRENVAALTQAAGLDETIKENHKTASVVGD